MDITQKFNEWCSKNLPLSVPGKEMEASDKMLEFFQSEITAAEQRGRNEVLEEIEKELQKYCGSHYAVGECFHCGFKEAFSRVKSIIQSHKA